MAEPEEISASKLCACSSCVKFRSSPVTADQFDFNTSKFNFKFPKVTKSHGEPPVDFEKLAAVFERRLASSEGMLVDAVRFITYYTELGELAGISMHDLILVCEYLYAHDLDVVIGSKQLALDFLRKICMFFVQSWHAFTNDCIEAEWSARKLRQFLAHIVTSPVIADQVNLVFTTTSFWPEVGPLQILETLCEKSLICMETVILLCNLTRIPGIAELLKRESKCIDLIKEKFWPCCRIIHQADELGGFLLHLLVNLTAIEGFAQFVIDSNAGYFMTVVVLDLISNQDISSTIQKAIWPFLRNLSLLDEGRQAIMSTIDIFLGPILYPIAGPEKFEEDEVGKLPVEVQYLPETKTRIEDKKIRECILDILYSLCRFKKDRITLRDAEVYQILKFYHLVEDDKQLIEKIENLVNILIRKEGSEIEVDDLMEGLSIQHKIKDTVPHNPEEQ